MPTPKPARKPLHPDFGLWIMLCGCSFTAGANLSIASIKNDSAAGVITLVLVLTVACVIRYENRNSQ